ncbi:hypothetical protein [Streptosporangium vulgare]|uniref:hypothetical protein n=1 Tax=Streptosporangium vulgare TaxID=46190 RepID=UPI0031DDE4E4
MLVRSATLRVSGACASDSARSHCRAMSTLKAQYAGTPSSVPPMTPVASSLARSWLCA